MTSGVSYLLKKNQVLSLNFNQCLTPKLNLKFNPIDFKNHMSGEKLNIDSVAGRWFRYMHARKKIYTSFSSDE